MKKLPLPAKFKAKIDQRGLKNVQLYFDQTLEGTICEMLQNSRRSKATNVEISIAPEGEKTRISILDNGKGIENPEVLLSLWKTGWDETIQSNELPAGMGFFSLCHLDQVQVRSNNWGIDLEKHHFQGEGEVEPYRRPQLAGTLISFLTDTKVQETTRTVQQCSRLFPIRTTINGKEVERKDPLESAEYIHEFNGGRIGVKFTPFTNYPYRDEINFYGKLLPMKNACAIPTVHARVDLTETRCLDLVLPSRDQIVENHKAEVLRTEIRKAAYLMAQKAKKHSFPYKYYQEALALGIQIPEATPKLWDARPSNIIDSPNWNGPGSSYRQLRQVRSEDVLMDAENSELASLYFAEGDIPSLVSPNESMQGYSWYPKKRLAGVEQVAWLKSGKVIKISEASRKDWEQITAAPLKKAEVQATITCGGESKTITLPTGFVFATDECGEDGLWGYWGHTADGLEKNIDEYWLFACFFYEQDGYEADSRDTQKEYFLREAEDALNTRLHGDEKAAKTKVQMLLDRWDVKDAIKRGKFSSVTLKLCKNGKLKISFEK